LVKEKFIPDYFTESVTNWIIPMPIKWDARERVGTRKEKCNARGHDRMSAVKPGVHRGFRT